MVGYGKMFECLRILMKIIEINEIIAEKSRGILTKLLISQLLVVIEYQSNTKTHGQK